MKKRFVKHQWVVCLLVCLFPVTSLQAQLSTEFSRVFTSIIGSNDEFGALDFPGTTEGHKGHFIPESQGAVQNLTNSLNKLIAGNVASFPLSSTSAGVTFDFSTGQPIGIRESLGPIFAETGKTLGKGKLNFGLNYTYLTMSRFRGVNTNDIRFTFLHADVNESGILGDLNAESDLLSVQLGLDVNASIAAFFGTYGLTENLDLGVAIPL